MAMSVKEIEFILSQTWAKAIGLTKTELLKVISSDDLKYSQATIDEILLKLDARIQSLNGNLIAVNTSKALGKTITATAIFNKPEFDSLKVLLNDDQKTRQRALRVYREFLKTAKKDLNKLKLTKEYNTLIDNIKVGRRNLDSIRSFTLKSLRKNFITGNQTALSKSEIYDYIVKNNKTVKPTKDGRATFDLEVRTKEIVNGKFTGRNVYQGDVRKFDVDNYSELTARTTSHLTQQEAFDIQAEGIGTRFIKFNDTGISKAKYKKQKDDKCAIINNNIFSRVKEVKQGNYWGAISDSGKFYRYIKEILNGFFIAHPNCNHIGKPYPEALA